VPRTRDALLRALARQGLKFDAGLRRVHLAIFVEPFLSMLFDGRKTLESRFSKVRCAPFGAVERGDLVVVKASSGPVTGYFRAGDVAQWEAHSLVASEMRVAETRVKHRTALGQPDEAWWNTLFKRAPRYATLLGVEHAYKIDAPFTVEAGGRAGWVVLEDQ
jgi:hypothetical protein